MKRQAELASLVLQSDNPSIDLDMVVGVDIAYSDEQGVACAVQMRLPDLKVVSEEYAVSKVSFAYKPGLLALREGALITQVLRRMDQRYPVLIDGNGVLHPRGFGLACSVGLELGITTIGVAKKLLLGEVGVRELDIAPITHAGRTLGAAVWLGRSSTAVYVSVGHKISLPTAVNIVRRASRSRIPEPLREAHIRARSHIGVT